jgi:hypothetical protein
VLAGDCTAPATTGTNLTPCSTTTPTLAAFFPYVSTADNTTYNLNAGQIETLAGVQAWVSNTPLSNTATTQYRVFYLANGQIYSASVVRDGTTEGVMPLGGTSPQNFTVFLNNAAVQSVKAAITF